MSEQRPSDGLSLRELTADFQRLAIASRIELCGGNITRTAKSLGIDRVGLYRRMKALGMGEAVTYLLATCALYWLCLAAVVWHLHRLDHPRTLGESGEKLGRRYGERHRERS